MTRTSITLDTAIEAWTERQNVTTAHDLLMTGLQYWNDDMIGDETFGEEVVKPVAQYLKLLGAAFR